MANRAVFMDRDGAMAKDGHQAVKDHDIEFRRSFVVGDFQMNIDLGKVLSCKTILIRDPSRNENEAIDPDVVTSDLLGQRR